MTAGTPNEPDNLTVTESNCEQLDDEGKDFQTNLRATSAEGRELSFTRRVIASPQDNSFDMQTDILADGQLVMTVMTHSTPDGVEVDVDYGPLAPGVESAKAFVENGMLTGDIDGRSLVPMDADTASADAATFQDGGAAPDSGIDPDLEAAVKSLLRAASDPSDQCEPNVATDTPKVATTQLRERDTGHDSDPESSGACIGCWAGCSAGSIACIGGVSAGCAASLIFYAACEAIGVASCGVAYLACIGGCNATGAPCCPVACGNVACCSSDETCLNSSIGICCSPGKTTCVGEECCSSTQVCIDSGPNAGTCCEPELICGNTCCEPTDSCIAEANLCCPQGMEPCDNTCCPEGETCLGNGNCCDPDLVCGSACCDELFGDCIPSKSLCCPFSTVACGDKCCDFGEGCVNGQCCPDERICSGGVCCPQGSYCDPQTNQCSDCPNPGEKYCPDSDSCCPEDKVCSPVAGVCCEVGELYCFGDCRPVSECIR